MRGEKPKREFKGAKWKYFRKEPTVPDAAARPKNRIALFLQQLFFLHNKYKYLNGYISINF